MKSVMRCSSLLLALVAFGSAAQAQDLMPTPSDRLVTFALGGGVSVPVSDAKDAFKNGFNGQGFVRLNLHQLPISPRLDFTYQSFDLKSAKLVAPAGGGTPSGTGKVFAGVANVQVPLMKGPIQPYVVAGLGAYNLSTDVNGSSSSKTQFGVNGGLGATLKVKTVSLYAEGRIDNLFTSNGPVNTKNIQLIPVTFGIMY